DGIVDEERRQLAAAAPADVVALGLGLGEALDRVGREFVDVGEDRLGEKAQRLWVEPRPAAGRRKVSPGDPRADAVGGLERVEGASLAQLSAAERKVDLAARLAAG